MKNVNIYIYILDFLIALLLYIEVMTPIQKAGIDITAYQPKASMANQHIPIVNVIEVIIDRYVLVFMVVNM
jgi:hypothetical protein